MTNIIKMNIDRTEDIYQSMTFLLKLQSFIRQGYLLNSMQLKSQFNQANSQAVVNIAYNKLNCALNRVAGRQLQGKALDVYPADLIKVFVEKQVQHNLLDLKNTSEFTLNKEGLVSSFFDALPMVKSLEIRDFLARLSTRVKIDQTHVNEVVNAVFLFMGLLQTLQDPSVFQPHMMCYKQTIEKLLNVEGYFDSNRVYDVLVVDRYTLQSFDDHVSELWLNKHECVSKMIFVDQSFVNDYCEESWMRVY